MALDPFDIGFYRKVGHLTRPRPRPLDPLDVMGCETFAGYARKLRAHFFAQGSLDSH